MNTKPYLIDGVIGNSKMLAAVSGNGQIQRLWWPYIDFPQHLNELQLGIFLPAMTPVTQWFHHQQWQHRQNYVGETNILRTVSSHPLGLEVQITDFCVPGLDVLVRRFRITNTSEGTLPLEFMLFSEMFISENKRYNTTYFEYKTDALVHYRHSQAFTWGADRLSTGFTVGNAFSQASQGMLLGNQGQMVADGALSWDLDQLSPGDTVGLDLFLAAGDDRHLAQDQLQKVRSLGGDHLEEVTAGYWKDFLAQSLSVSTSRKDLDQLYRRSLLVFKLMQDEATGGLIAAPEPDENRDRCGGYAYCWGRDAAYITDAIDKAGYSDMVSKFYRWAREVQEPSGAWDQRYFVDGRLAPAWGLQIDQCGSMLWGLAQHWSHTGNKSFLEEMWPSVWKGASFLLNYIDSETQLPLPSNDLWEERWGEHTYSSTAVWGGLKAAAGIAEVLGYLEDSKVWQQQADSLKAVILGTMWSEKRKRFLRGIKVSVRPQDKAKMESAGEPLMYQECSKGYRRLVQLEDDIIDVSLLGLTVPFGLLPANDPRMQSTAAAIDKKLWSPRVGGIKRYENDDYIGGNPWILTTLWLALYYLEVGNGQRAQELLDWVIGHRTNLDMLPEQIDKTSGNSAWVIPLTWSHAMLVLTVVKMYGQK